MGSKKFIGKEVVSIMNSTETRIFHLLRTLHDDYNAFAVKAEFEAEGSRAEELSRLSESIFRSGMNLTIKIGGCEAFSDLKYAAILGAGNIMAPMIESPFAMKKFKRMAHKFCRVKSPNDTPPHAISAI